MLIEFVDDACHSVLVHPDATPTNVKIGDFNRAWMGDVFPQWGKTN
jgi:hypothetical protein